MTTHQRTPVERKKGKLFVDESWLRVDLLETKSALFLDWNMRIDFPQKCQKIARCWECVTGQFMFGPPIASKPGLSPCVETNQLVCSSSNVILTRQTCGQCANMVAQSKPHELTCYFSTEICYMSFISKWRAEWDLGSVHFSSNMWTKDAAAQGRLQI